MLSTLNFTSLTPPLQVQSDPCSPNPCQNKAQCHSLSGDFSCTCSDAYEGKTCSELRDHCKTNECQGNGYHGNILRPFVHLCLSVCLSFCLSVCLSLCVCLSVCLSLCLSVCLSFTCLSVCLFLCLSVCLSFTCPSVSMSVCLYLRLSVCMSVCLSFTCLSVSLRLSVSSLTRLSLGVGSSSSD